MSAIPYYVQRIKDFNPHELEKRKKMMQENGFKVISEGKEFMAMHGRVRYWVVLRREM